MKLSNAGLILIKTLEGTSNKAYRDVAGYWTIGVGHLIIDNDKELLEVLGVENSTIVGIYNKPSESLTYFGNDNRIDVSTIVLTDEQVDALLKKDIEEFVRGVNAVLEVEVAQCEFDALVSLAFNIGLAGFYRSSVLRKLNEGIEEDLSKYFALWNKITIHGKKVESRGLTRRRHIESMIFHSQFKTQDKAVHDYNINLYSNDGGVS